ncbi:MAG: hypothetical protein IJC39_05295 [Firmicutes bacterium]|nr:hypothetical protein [Bacillota bacterium]
MKIGLYMQYLRADKCTQKEYELAMKKVKDLGIDLMALPERSYTAFSNLSKWMEILDREAFEIELGNCESMSIDSGAAVIYSSEDATGIVYSMYADIVRKGGNTYSKLYIKHLGENFSPLEMEDYSDWAEGLFEAVSRNDEKFGFMHSSELCSPVFTAHFKRAGAQFVIVLGKRGETKEDILPFMKLRAKEVGYPIYAFVPAEEDEKPFALGVNPAGGLITGTMEQIQGKKNKLHGNIMIFDTAAPVTEAFPAEIPEAPGFDEEQLPEAYRNSYRLLTEMIDKPIPEKVRPKMSGSAADEIPPEIAEIMRRANIAIAEEMDSGDSFDPDNLPEHLKTIEDNVKDFLG